MNKAQLVETLSARLGEDKKRTAATVEALLDTVYRTVQKGEKVALTGFGVFEKRDRAARTARNPATGEKVKVKKTSVPAFRAGQEFKNVVNGSKKLPKVAPTTPATKAAGTRAASNGAATASTAKATAARTTAAKASATAPAKKAAKSTATKSTTAPAKKAAKTAAAKNLATKTPAAAPAKKSAAAKTLATSTAGTAPAKKAAKSTARKSTRS